MSFIHRRGCSVGSELGVLAISLSLLTACGSNEDNPEGGSTASATQTQGAGTSTTTAASQTSATMTTTTATTGAAAVTTTGASDGASTASQSASTGGASSASSTGGASSSSDTSSGAGGGQGQAFTLSSPAFAGVEGCSASNASVCDLFPDENISYMEGPNNSPELNWAGVPAGTQSFVVGFYDLTSGQPLWAIWNLSADLSGLPANIDKSTATPANLPGSQQSNATFAEGDGYFGPSSPCNVYQFVVHALSVPTVTPSQPEYVAVVLNEIAELGEVILGSATLSARTNYQMMCE